MAIVRLVVLLIIITNQILISRGFTPFPYDEEQIYEFVNGVALVAVSVWAWWKNNSITKEAQEADKVLASEKKRNKAARQ